MPGKHPPQHSAQRRRQAAELAARYMREAGLPLPRARDKAAARLGLDLRPGNPALPSDAQVRQALATQLSLFAPAHRLPLLDQRRRAALEAMGFLHHFHPRLAGAVLEGSAQGSDPVILHLHPDTPEDVAVFLEEHRLPAHLRSAQITLADGRHNVPCWHLVVDDTDFQLWVLPALALQQPPLLTGNPPAAMERASAARLRALIAG